MYTVSFIPPIAIPGVGITGSIFVNGWTQAQRGYMHPVDGTAGV